MDLESAPIREQAAAFERMVLSNPVVATIVERMGQLDLPGCYLAAGALCQTVWNVLGGLDPGAAIRDYDVDYFDAADLSEEGEEAVRRRGGEVFADLGAQIDLCNEARVHLWYERRFGVPCPPYASTEAAIRTFPSTSACLGVRPRAGGLDVYAPFGFADLFAPRTRPNPVLAPREVYETKTARWKLQWPQLEILPWPSGSP